MHGSNLRIALALVFVLSPVIAFGSERQWILPGFAEAVPGANGSLWHSELRVYNGDIVVHTVSIDQIFVTPGQQCQNPIHSVALAPGEQSQLFSLGCGANTIVAAAISADELVHVSSVVTNTAPATTTTPCCPVGFTQVVATVPQTSSAKRQFIVNVPLANEMSTGLVVSLNRHNLGVINPGSVELVLYMRPLGSIGQPTPSPNAGEFRVPPNSFVQFPAVLPVPAAPIGGVFASGYFQLELTGDQPFFAYLSVVDNQTNDATMILPISR